MSACQDGVIRFFDTSDPTRVWPLKREVYARDVGWAIVDTCYSPDRHFVIYSSWSRFVHLVTLDGERHEALPLMEEGFNRYASTKRGFFRASITSLPPPPPPVPASSVFPGGAFCTRRLPATDARSLPRCTPALRGLQESSGVRRALTLAPVPRHVCSICPFSIRFSADSREILCGTNLNAVYIYDCIRDHLALSAEVHETDVNAVAFADASSNIFITGSDDYLCKVWDRRSLDPSHPVPVGTLVGHQGGITYIDSKNDGRYFISQGKDSVVKLWDIRRMEADPQRPRVNYRQDYRYGPIRHRSRGLRNDMSLMTYKGHEVRRTLIRARFSPASTGQRYIYSGSGDGSIYIWNVLDGSLEDQLAGHQGLVRDVSWHPDKPALASSSVSGVRRCLCARRGATHAPSHTSAARLARLSFQRAHIPSKLRPNLLIRL